jgi:PAS domain-containing protein
MRLKSKKIVRALLLSILLVVIAECLSWALHHFDQKLQGHGIFTFFLAAVVIAAWRGGFIAAIFTTIFSVAVAAWVMPPENSFRVSDEQDVVRLAMFIFVAGLISYLQGAKNRAEASLQESEGRLRFSLDSSGIGCWDADIKNGTFWKSHNLTGIFGRSDEEFASTYEGFFAYIYPEDREFFHLAAVGGGSSQRDYEISHRIICGDGTVRQVKTRGKMYLGQDGNVERMVGTVYSMDSNLVAPAPHPVVRNPRGLPSLSLI